MLAPWLALTLLTGSAGAEPLGDALQPLLRWGEARGRAGTAVAGEVLSRGLAARAAGEHRQAALLLAKHARERPLHPAAQLLLGLALDAMARHAEAARCYRRALRLAPPAAWATLRRLPGLSAPAAEASDWSRLIYLRFAGDPSPEAVGALLSGLTPAERQLASRLFPQAASERKRPPGADPYISGMHAFRAGRFADAADLFASAAVAEPGFGSAAFFVVHAAVAQGEHELAARLLARALDRHPAWAGHHIALREYFGHAQRLVLDQQVGKLREAVRAGPAWWPEGLVLIGYLLYADGEYKAARELFSRFDPASAARPAVLEACRQRMIAWCDQHLRGEIPRRRPVVPSKPAPRPMPSPKPAPKPSPKPGPALAGGDPADPLGDRFLLAEGAKPSAEALAELAALRARQGRRREALAAITHAASMAPQRLDLTLQLAAAQLASGQYREAGLSARRALARDPEAALDWRRFFPDQARYDKASAALEELRAARSKDLALSTLAALVAWDQQRLERALELLTINLTIDPRDTLSQRLIDTVSNQIVQAQR